MEINPLRGEAALKLDGITYILRPTFAALARIEHELSCNVFSLAQKLEDGSITLNDITVIIDHCMENRAERTFLHNALLRNGLCQALEAVGNLMINILGGFDHEV